MIQLFAIVVVVKCRHFSSTNFYTTPRNKKNKKVRKVFEKLQHGEAIGRDDRGPDQGIRNGQLQEVELLVRN